MSSCLPVFTGQTDQEERYNTSALTRVGNINFRCPVVVCLEFNHLKWLNVQ